MWGIFGQFRNFNTKLPCIHVGYTVMQMRKTNREKGYFTERHSWTFYVKRQLYPCYNECSVQLRLFSCLANPEQTRNSNFTSDCNWSICTKRSQLFKGVLNLLLMLLKQSLSTILSPSLDKKFPWLGKRWSTKKSCRGIEQEREA